MTSRREFLQSLLIVGTTVTLAPQILLPAKLSEASHTTDLTAWGEAVHYDITRMTSEYFTQMQDMLEQNRQLFARKIWRERRTYLIPESVQWIHKPLGSAGTIDPINQHGAIAWKAYGFSAPAWMTHDEAAHAGTQLWEHARRGHTKIARLSYGTRVAA